MSSNVRRMSSIIRTAPGRLEPFDPDRLGLVAQFPQAQRLGEAAGRVDGEDDRPPAAFGRADASAARGGLADPAGATAGRTAGPGPRSAPDLKAAGLT